jgi:GH18 family chitinase
MKRVSRILAAVLTVAASALAGCGGGTAGNAPALPSTPAYAAPLSPLAREASSGFAFVGYWDGWSKNNLTSTPSGVTEVPIAFGFLRGHTITLQGINSGYVTASDIASLHARGIKVTLSLGGWSPSNAFVFDGNVAGFESSLASVLAKLPFDGVDFDEEHGSTATRVHDMETLIPATRAFFNKRGMPGAVITQTAWNRPNQYGDGTILKNASVASTISWVNVMSYEHNNVSATEADLQAYAAVFNKAKLMMGVDIDDAPIPTNSSLKTLSSWARSNGYGGMMAWTINSITSQQLAAITGQ